jgi:hypothetical protein
MKTKVLGVVAAFALLGFSPANASTFTYNLFLASPPYSGGGLLTGTITTDCNSCTLSASDITAYSVTGIDGIHSPFTITSAAPGAFFQLVGPDLIATPSGIFFNFGDQTTPSYFWMFSPFGSLGNYSQFALINAGTDGRGSSGHFKFFNDNLSGPQTIFIGTQNLFDLTSIAYPVSPTPVPAALPLFATGLAVMGLLGWRRKRNAAAKATAV